ncbi:MAG: Gfo/Idh/MocA family oxidoreductase [Armatimonadota bacterium]|nr:MAG: Gfo/Idh/MocA family oxidoreductase [Armatimonadota bacterium]
MVKIGVVGVGTFGVNHLRAFTQTAREGVAEVVAAADLDEKRLAEAARQFGVRGYANHREMLEREELDALTVVTPDFAHREVTLDALAAGKHVLVEKPLDVTVAGCREMVEAAQKAGLLLQVDFHKRYDPYHLELERLARQGKLGDVLYGYCHMEDRIEVPRDWFPQWAPQSSPVWFLGVHFYDLARWVLKSDGRSVFARGQKRKLAGLGVDTYDSVQAQVEFQNGAVVTFDTSWILPDQFEAIVNQGIRLVGTEGMIEVDSQDRGARSCFSANGMQTHNLGFLRETMDKRGDTVWLGYGIESIADFAYNVAFLRDGGESEGLHGVFATGDDGLEVTKIACAAEDSLRSGQKVDI